MAAAGIPAFGHRQFGTYMATGCSSLNVSDHWGTTEDDGGKTVWFVRSLARLRQAGARGSQYTTSIEKDRFSEPPQACLRRSSASPLRSAHSCLRGTAAALVHGGSAEFVETTFNLGFAALRVEVGRAGSDPGRRGAPGPGHTTGVKLDPQVIMLEAGEAMAAQLILFTHRFMPTVGPLEAPVRRWFKISDCQRSSVSPSERISATSSLLKPTMALFSSVRASPDLLSQVDVPHRFLGLASRGPRSAVTDQSLVVGSGARP